jgi:hypothetical protein
MGGDRYSPRTFADRCPREDVAELAVPARRQPARAWCRTGPAQPDLEPGHPPDRDPHRDPHRVAEKRVQRAYFRPRVWPAARDRNSWAKISTAVGSTRTLTLPLATWRLVPAGPQTAGHLIAAGQIALTSHRGGNPSMGAA